MKTVTNQARPLRKFHPLSPWRSAVKPIFPAILISDSQFNIDNDESQTSNGFERFGLIFKQGDIPEYTSVEIYRDGSEIPAQFDQRVTWPDGSLRFAVCSMRDTNFTPNESRTYEWRQSYKPFDNAGTRTLADVRGMSDFTVALTNNQRFNGSANEADPVGTDLTASFNEHSLVTTRVSNTLNPIYGDRIHSGPVCETWEVWGMFKNSSDTEHAHLKTIWVVTAWKDAGGNIVDLEYGATVSQDWRSEADKYRQDYNAQLRDGATVVQDYLNVQHPYHSQWHTVDLDPRNTRYAKRFFKNSAPTLHYKPNQTYWIKSGLIDPYDLGNASNALNSSTVYDSPYVPCQSIDHRAAIDNTGAYMGRGVLPNVDVVAFLSGDPERSKHVRTNAFAGLHIPYHCRDSATRTRQGESADIANTLMPLALEPKQASEYTFTDIGMPAPRIMSNDSRSLDEYEDGFVAPIGGAGEWSPSADASHAVNYSYYQYLISGEPYFKHATNDLAIYTTLQQVAGAYGSSPNGLRHSLDTYRQPLFNIPTDRWTSIGGLNMGSNTRAIGWALNLMSSAYAISPDDDIETRQLRAYVDHNLDWMGDSIDYLTQDDIDRGLFFFNGESPSLWMQSFICLGGLATHKRIGSTKTQKVADLLINLPTFIASDPLPYMAQTYRISYTNRREPWSDTNPFLPQVFGYPRDCASDSASNTFAAGTSYMNLTEDDPIIFADKNESAQDRAIPAGFVEGQVYYAVNVSGDVFSVAETAGGAALPVTDDVLCAIVSRPQNAATTPAVYAAPYLPGEDTYSIMLIACLKQAHTINDTVATQALVDKFDAWLINRDFNDFFCWAYGEIS